MTHEFLDPRRTLVDETVRALCARVRACDGARSLDHVMVVVPTAQSDRALRLTLAEEAARRGWGGILPPRVVEPIHLIVSDDTSLAVASPVLLRAAFLSFLGGPEGAARLASFPHLFGEGTAFDERLRIDLFEQFADIWRILAGGGLTMADVPDNPAAAATLAAAMGDEAVRWRELAAFEKDFFAYLAAFGLRHPADDMKRARTSPKPLPDGIEEVLLPALADPIVSLYDVLAHPRTAVKITVLIHADACEAGKFDLWGRPLVEAWTGPNRPLLTELRDADILGLATDRDLAQQVARDFPLPGEACCRPALGLCDEKLYSELSAAFLNRGYTLNNPQRHRIRISSLGRILGNLLDLYAAREKGLPWTPFVRLLREDDVLTAFTGGAGSIDRVQALAGADVFQNRFLPVSLKSALAYDEEAVSPHDRVAFGAFLAFGRAVLGALEAAGLGADDPVGFLRETLKILFAKRALSGTDEETEFRAATDAVRGVLDTFESSAFVAIGLSTAATVALLRQALDEATYMLEPAGRQALNTLGWLELAWSPADKIALAGLTEGTVPDSVVGHPFVPDDLRVALKLTSNRGRLARDTMILTDIVRARAATPGAIRVYWSRSNAAGEQRRPSRLLYLVGPNDLAMRARHLFSDAPAGERRAARRLEEAWRLRLPLEDLPLRHVSEENPLGRLSASAIDAYLKCPLTYLFEYPLGMRAFVEKKELEANDFGSLLHGVLEDYAREELARMAEGFNPLADVRDVAAAFSRLLSARRAAYAAETSLRVRLQFDAAEGRLKAFAPLQAKWVGEGWRIAEVPEYAFAARPFAGEDGVDLPFTGKIDRIDFHPAFGYRIIDYKTWDLKKSALQRVIAGGAKELAHAARLHLPVLRIPYKNGSFREARLLSVQLLLYARALAVAEERFAGRVADCCYVILGRDAENACVLGSALEKEAYVAGKGFVLLDHGDVALDTVRAAIRLIRGNVFWPPGPGEHWKFNFKSLFMDSPERDLPVGTPWRDRQEAKLNALAGGAR